MLFKVLDFFGISNDIHSNDNFSKFDNYPPFMRDFVNDAADQCSA